MILKGMLEAPEAFFERGTPDLLFWRMDGHGWDDDERINSGPNSGPSGDLNKPGVNKIDSSSLSPSRNLDSEGSRLLRSGQRVLNAKNLKTDPWQRDTVFAVEVKSVSDKVSESGRQDLI